MPTVTVKFTDQQFAKLERLARERRVPKAQVLRESFERTADGATAGSMYDLVADLAGTAHGPKDLTTNKKYMEGFGLDGPKRRTFWKRALKH